MPGYKTGLMPVISVIGIDLLAFHKWLDFNVDLIYLCYENLKKSQSRRRLSMKKLIAVTLLLLVAGNAYALTDLALGVYGGLNAPLAQQDTKSGAGFGAKVKIAPTPLLGAAAFFETRSFGEPEVTIFEGDPDLQQTLKTDGGKVTERRRDRADQARADRHHEHRNRQRRRPCERAVGRRARRRRRDAGSIGYFV
jgi:hypothetical protein